MSASDKLRVFMADERWASHDATVLAGLALTLKESGLPQLLAVVEAAERARAADWQPHGKSYWEIEQLLNEIRDSADATLAALDEKLTGAEHPPGAERTQ